MDQQNSRGIKRSAQDDLNSVCPRFKKMKISDNDYENCLELQFKLSEYERKNDESMKQMKNSISSINQKIVSIENTIEQINKRLNTLGSEFDRITDNIFDQLDDCIDKIKQIPKINTDSDSNTYMPYIK